MVFIKKHYKKFLIFCSLFILSFTILFSNPNEVNAQGLTSNTSYYYSSSSYIDFPLAVGYPNFRVDLPFTYNGALDYSLSALIMGDTTTLDFKQSYIDVGSSYSTFYSKVGILQTTFFWNRGPISFFTSSLLYDATATDATEGNFQLSNLISCAPGEVITCEYNFKYLLYNEDSKSLISNTYSSSQVQSHNYATDELLRFSVLDDFVNSLTVNYDYYYFYDIYLSFSSTSTNYTDSDAYFLFPLTTEFIDNNQSFIDLNGFDLGLTDSELDVIYNEGYAAGVDSVNTQDYYNQGYTHASEDFLKFENLVFGVMNGFTNTISQLLDFEIFGISIFGLIGGLVAVAFGVGITIIVIKIIKMFI